MSNAIFNMKIVALDESWLNRETKSYYIPLKEIVLAHFQSLFGKSNHDAFWENAAKIHKRGCVKEFFL